MMALLLQPLIDLRDRVFARSDYNPNMKISEFKAYMNRITGQHVGENARVSDAVKLWESALDGEN